MLKRFSFFLILFSILGVSAFGVQAQEVINIAYDDVYEGTMTATESDFVFSFNAIKGEVVVINVQSKSGNYDFDEPTLRVEDSQQQVVFDTNEGISYGRITAAFDVGANGLYFIYLSRKSETTLGDFIFSIISVPMISPNTVTEGRLVNTPDNAGVYYVARFNQPFDLVYLKRTGDMNPEITVYAIETETGLLDDVATVNGRIMKFAQIGEFEAGTTYLVVMRRKLLDLSFGSTLSVGFELSLIPTE